MYRLKSLILASIVILTGCSSTGGDRIISTEFDFPNSNVEALGGEVSATTSRSSILVAPTLKKDKFLALYDEALSQSPGAEMLINARINTKMTFYPIILPFFTMRTTIEGTPAKMEIGEQELRDYRDAMSYEGASAE
jgi:hypothetical protein